MVRRMFGSEGIDFISRNELVHRMCAIGITSLHGLLIWNVRDVSERFTADDGIF